MGVLAAMEALVVITLRILDRDVVPESTKVQTTQNKIGSISATIGIAPFMGEYLTEKAVRSAMKLQDIAIYADGVLIVSGIVTDVSMVEIGGATGFVKISGEDEFGRLGKYWSSPSAHYQNTALLVALSDLLTLPQQPYGWELGDTSTMIDPAATIVVNLRTKEHLWPQLVEAVEKVPQTHIRYGGINPINGRRRFDVGFFGEQDDGFYAYENENIIGKPAMKRTPSEPIKKVRPKGGKAGSIVIKLFPDDRLTLRADFPLEWDSVTSSYVVVNNRITTGIYTAKTYAEIRTDNAEPPTTAQLWECRQALYDATVRDMLISEDQEIVTLECVLPRLPRIGENINIRSQALAPIFDPFTGRTTWALTEDIDGSYRITEIKWNFDKHMGAAKIYNSLLQNGTGGYIVELQCTTGESVGEYDPLLYLAGKLANQDEDEPIGAGVGLGGNYITSVQHAGVESDCTKGSTDGKLFEFTFDSPPSSKVKTVEYNVLSVTGVATYSVIQEPTPTLPLILCVTNQGNTDWTPASDVTVQIEYVYYT